MMRRDRDRETEQGLLRGFIRDENKVNKTTILAVCCSCVGGLMFGYDTSLVNSLLVLLKDDLGHVLSSTEKEVITSVTSFGALIGSAFGGVFNDVWGRKKMIGVACITFIISALIMSMSNTVAEMVIGRFVAGLAIGSASTTVPIYIAEVSPSKHRGKLIALNATSTTGGQVLALLAGWQFGKYTKGWRYMLAIGALPPLLFLIAVGGIPESPRYLIKRNRISQAEQALHQLHPSASFRDIQDLLNEQAQDSTEESFSFRRMFQRRASRNALIVACSLMAVQQLCGINVYMYYSSTMFENAGFENPIFISMIVVCGVNFIFSWVPVVYVDVLGRRRMLLYTLFVMAISLVVTALIFDNIKLNGLLVLTTVVYITSYASALGSIPWQSTEFLPLDVRSLGSMMISATNWILNALVSLTFLTAMDIIKSKGVFMFYAFFTFVGWIGVVYCYPEVAGMNLEDISHIFDTRITNLGKLSSL